MSDFKSIIIFKKAHKTVPLAFLERVLKENPSCGGMAMATFDQEPQLFSDETSNPDADWFNTVQEPGQFLDNELIFHMGNYPKDYLIEDHQPFTLLSDAKNRPLIAAFLDGDFSDHAEVDSKHSAEFFAATTYLAPKMAQMYRLMGEDLKKLCLELKTNLLVKELSRTFKGHGTLVLVSALGDVLNYEDNPNLAEFDWGCATNSYGYSETVAAPPKKEEPPRELTTAEKIAAHRAKKALEAKGEVQEPAKEPAKEIVREPVKEVPRSEPNKNGELSSEELMFKFKLEKPATGNMWMAPRMNSSRSEKKDFYTRRKIKLPENWKDGPPIQVPLTAIGQALSVAKAKIPTATDTAPVKPSPLPAAVPTVPAKVEPKQEPADVKDPIPQLEPNLQKHLIDHYLTQPKVKAFLDADNEEILNPNQLADIEKKYPNVVEQLGLTEWSQLYKLPFSELDTMSKKYPPLMAVLCFWALVKCRSHDLKETAQITVKDTSNKNIPQSDTGTAPPAPRKSAFGRR